MITINSTRKALGGELAQQFTNCNRLKPPRREATTQVRNDRWDMASNHEVHHPGQGREHMGCTTRRRAKHCFVEVAGSES